MSHEDPLYLDVENWSLRVAEALDLAAELRGNTLIYVTADPPPPRFDLTGIVVVTETPFEEEEES